jgi:hypothetical protein
VGQGTKSLRSSPLRGGVSREVGNQSRLLVARGASLETTNGRGATPLSLAVRALVEQSDWTPHASPEIVAVLLDAGARVDTVHPFPSGSLAADALLRERGRAG